MQISTTSIDQVVIVTPQRFTDARGYFSETYNKRALAEAGVTFDFVQDNHVRSTRAGTIRGLHFQRPPFAQAKLVRVAKGRIIDVVVDLRRSSPTFGRHVAVELSDESAAQILIPVGCAHGYQTLEPGVEVIYKVSHYYAPDHECGLAWNDPTLGIEWRPTAGGFTLSERDLRQPTLLNLIETARTFP